MVWETGVQSERIENGPLAIPIWLREHFLSAHFLVGFCYLVSNYLLIIVLE